MNQTIYLWLHSFAHQSASGDWLIVFAAQNLGWIFLAILAGGVLLYRRRPKIWEAVLTCLGVAILAWIFSQLINSFYPSARPFMIFGPETALFIHGAKDAFPSGHAAFFFGLAVALYFYHRRLGHFATMVALLIGLARVMAGVHWPADIFGGLILAIIVGWLWQRMESIMKRKI